MAKKTDKKQPIVVSSKNDPRYIAYQDSLGLAVNSRMAEQEFVNKFKRKNVKYTPEEIDMLAKIKSMPNQLGNVKEIFNDDFLSQNGIIANKKVNYNAFDKTPINTSYGIGRNLDSDGKINRELKQGKYKKNSEVNKKTIADNIFSDDTKDVNQEDIVEYGPTINRNIKSKRILPHKTYTKKNSNGDYFENHGSLFRKSDIISTDVYTPPYFVFEHNQMKPVEHHLYNYDVGAKQLGSNGGVNRMKGVSQLPTDNDYDANEMYNVDFPIYKYPEQPVELQTVPKYIPKPIPRPQQTLQQIPNPQYIQQQPQVGQINPMDVPQTGYNEYINASQFLNSTPTSKNFYTPKFKKGGTINTYQPVSDNTGTKNTEAWRKQNKIDSRTGIEFDPNVTHDTKQIHQDPKTGQVYYFAEDGRPIVIPQGTISKAGPRVSKIQKAWDYMSNPVAALPKFFNPNYELPDHANVDGNASVFNDILNTVNPATYINAGARALTGKAFRDQNWKDTSESKLKKIGKGLLGEGLDVLTALPMLNEIKIGKKFIPKAGFEYSEPFDLKNGQFYTHGFSENNPYVKNVLLKSNKFKGKSGKYVEEIPTSIKHTVKPGEQGYMDDIVYKDRVISGNNNKTLHAVSDPSRATHTVNGVNYTDGIMDVERNLIPISQNPFNFKYFPASLLNKTNTKEEEKQFIKKGEKMFTSENSVKNKETNKKQKNNKQIIHVPVINTDVPIVLPNTVNYNSRYQVLPIEELENKEILEGVSPNVFTSSLSTSPDFYTNEQLQYINKKDKQYLKLPENKKYGGTINNNNMRQYKNGGSTQGHSGQFWDGTKWVSSKGYSGTYAGGVYFQNGGGVSIDVPMGQMQTMDNEYAINTMENGGIHIDPSKRGTFTAAATKHGKSVQGFASQVLANKDNYSPAMVKKANFAKNFAKKKYGGYVKGSQHELEEHEIQALINKGYKIRYV